MRHQPQLCLARLGVLGLAASSPALAQSTIWQADGQSSGERFGLAVAKVGDINGDGLVDVVAGAPNNDLGGSDAGAAFVLSGADGSTLLTIQGGSAGDSLGFSVSGAGDVDGDGTPDVIAGARFSDDAGSNFGQAVVVSGATGAILQVFDGTSSNGRFGEAVGAAGDVNADGFADVIVGARLDATSGSQLGAARVYSGFDGALLYDLAGLSSNDFFGRSVGSAGDTNGDGFDDFLVGAPGDDDSGSNSGSVFLFSGFDGTLLFQFTGDFAGDSLGGKVAGLGDINGDGFDDLVAGMIGSDFSGTDRGAARVFSGADGSTLFTFGGSSLGGEFGSAVSAAGDLDGDGIMDVLVGARLDENALGLSAGSASVFSGATGALLLRLESDSSFDQFGDTATCGGDLNGDGFDDIVVGAFGLSGAASGGGRVLAFSGADPIGDTICGPAVSNSTGFPAHLEARGSTVALDNRLSLSVTGLPMASNGYFLTSLNELTLVMPGGSVGDLCIASNVIGRYAGNVLNSGTSGAVSMPIDLTMVPGSNTTLTVLAGETRYWQFWYRDVPASNFSDAVRITFQ